MIYRKLKRNVEVKILSALLITAAICIVLLSCKHGGESADSTGNTPDTTAAETHELVLCENGEFRFTIVRGCADQSSSIVSDMRKKLQNASGSSYIAYENDDGFKESFYDPDKYEILAGNTEYPESAEAIADLPLGEYRITVKGNKIVIAAHSPAALSAAADAFVSYVIENTDADGRIAVSSDLVLSGTCTEKISKLVCKYLPNLGEFRVVSLNECGDDFYQATFTGMTREVFDRLCAGLEAGGAEKYAHNSMPGAVFATYTKDKALIHTYFVEHSGEIRAVIAEGKPLPSVAEVEYKKVCEPTFTLMGLEKGGSSGGLGCILRLEDGSFIIIDGGHKTAAEGDDIYQTLLSQSTDGKVVIRAWIFTHAHGDHYGAFMSFSSRHASDKRFTVESFIFNYCNTKEQNQFSASGNFDSTYNTINKYWKNVTVYKGLTGQVYRFAGCDMEILYCMSDFIPQVIGLERSDADKSAVDGNLQNMTMRFSVAGQKILVTGDASKYNVDEMCDRYGEYLKSDIMTVPHHGWNENRYRARNGTVEFYRFVDPVYVMWPDGDAAQQKKMQWDGVSGSNWEANYYLINSLHVKELYVAGSVTKTFVLPYSGSANQ